MFIVVEGIDGSGKSTTLKELSRYFENKNHNIHKTVEPTALDTGKMIRSYLGNKTGSPLIHHKLALLFAADRINHLEKEVLPALEEGKTVISDRYFFSSIAYQSVNLPYEWVVDLNRYARFPDLLFYIDVSIDTALSRIARFREGTELYETREFLTAIKNNYERVLENYKDKLTIIRLNGEVGMDEISDDIYEKIKQAEVPV